MEKIKELRTQTKTSIADCKEALEETNGDIKKALKYLNQKGAEILKNKEARATKNGTVASYIHTNKKIGVLVELACETDFAAKTSDFQDLAKELTLQIAAIEPKNVEDLLKQPYIRDESITVANLVQTVATKIKENIKINRFCRLQI